MKSTQGILKLTSEFGKNDGSGSCAISKKVLTKNLEWVRWNYIIINRITLKNVINVLTEKARTTLHLEPPNKDNTKGVTKYG